MRNASILARIGGLALAITLAVQAISVTVVLLTPPPVLPRMSPAKVLMAISDPQVAGSANWRRVEADESPFETTAGTGRIVAAGLTNALGVPPERVRVQMIAQPQPGEDTGTITSIVSTGGLGAGSLAGPGSLRVAQADALAAGVVMMPGFSLPAFRTAVLQDNGSWLIVEPPDGGILRWLTRLTATLALSVLLIAPLVWWAAQRLTLPVRALARAAGATNFLGLSQTNAIQGPPEIMAVAEAMEDMHRRLTTQVEQRMRILAAVAHDLRTPLTSLRLRAETAPPIERDRMASDISRMETMIAEVLAFSEAGLARGECRPMNVIEACAGVSTDPAFQGLVTLVPSPETFILADQDRVRRILFNLVENAVRYGEAVEIFVEVAGDNVGIVVADRGPGMAPEQLEKVFEPFYRLEYSRSRSTGGAGLGLAICRELASLDSGCVKLQPRVSGGLEARLTYRRCQSPL